MSFFSKLFGKREPTFDERIWPTDAAKLADVVRGVRASAESGVFPLVVHHFEDTGASIEKALEGAKIRCRRVTDFDVVRAGNLGSWRTAGQAMILASSILPWEVRSGEPEPPNAPDALAAHLHLCEHHPTRSGDVHVLSLHRALGLASTPTCYTSLDEPWLHHFGTGRLQEVIVQLGLEETERLQHSMITKAVHKAQDRIARQITQEVPAATCAEWVRRNLQ